MLGTLSHFGWNRRVDLKDVLQGALERMFDLLTVDGLLILGTWSDTACEKKNMLSIYRLYDRELLSEWTPDRKELARRLKAAGFDAIRQASGDVRLDFWTCERAKLLP
jgi:hypothetical protein